MTSALIAAGLLLYMTGLGAVARFAFPRVKVTRRTPTLSVPCPHLQTDPLAGTPGYGMCRSCYAVIRNDR